MSNPGSSAGNNTPLQRSRAHQYSVRHTGSFSSSQLPPPQQYRLSPFIGAKSSASPPFLGNGLPPNNWGSGRNDNCDNVLHSITSLPSSLNTTEFDVTISTSQGSSKDMPLPEFLAYVGIPNKKGASPSGSGPAAPVWTYYSRPGFTAQNLTQLRFRGMIVWDRATSLDKLSALLDTARICAAYGYVPFNYPGWPPPPLELPTTGAKTSPLLGTSGGDSPFSGSTSSVFTDESVTAHSFLLSSFPPTQRGEIVPVLPPTHEVVPQATCIMNSPISSPHSSGPNSANHSLTLSPLNTPAALRPIGLMRNRTAVLRVATYNIFFELWDADGSRHSVERVPLIIQELERLDADVIALQEVTPWFFEKIRSGSAMLRSQYYWTTVPERVNGGRDFLAFTQVTLSRYPIVDSAFMKLSRHKRCLFTLIFMEASTTAESKPEDNLFVVANCHLSSDYQKKLGELASVRTVELETIIAGLTATSPKTAVHMVWPGPIITNPPLLSLAEETNVKKDGVSEAQPVSLNRRELSTSAYTALMQRVVSILTTSSRDVPPKTGATVSLGTMPAVLLGDFNHGDGDIEHKHNMSKLWPREFKDAYLSTRSVSDEAEDRYQYTYDSSRNSDFIPPEFPPQRFDRVILRDLVPVGSATVRLFGTKPTKTLVTKHSAQTVAQINEPLPPVVQIHPSAPTPGARLRPGAKPVVPPGYLAYPEDKADSSDAPETPSTVALRKMGVRRSTQMFAESDVAMAEALEKAEVVPEPAFKEVVSSPLKPFVKEKESEDSSLPIPNIDNKVLMKLYPSDHFGVVCNVERVLRTPPLDDLTPLPPSVVEIEERRTTVSPKRATGAASTGRSPGRSPYKSPERQGGIYIVGDNCEFVRGERGKTKKLTKSARNRLRGSATPSPMPSPNSAEAPMPVAPMPSLHLPPATDSALPPALQESSSSPGVCIEITTPGNSTAKAVATFTPPVPIGGESRRTSVSSEDKGREPMIDPQSIFDDDDPAALFTGDVTPRSRAGSSSSSNSDRRSSSSSNECSDKNDDAVKKPKQRKSRRSRPQHRDPENENITDSPSDAKRLLTTEHFFKSFATALCVIPPPSVCSKIDLLRERYDKSFVQWMPHLNLLFPFVHPAKFTTAIPLLEEITKNMPPFRVLLRRLGVFGEDDPNCKKLVIYLVPELKSEVLTELQNRVQETFPHCVRHNQSRNKNQPQGRRMRRQQTTSQQTHNPRGRGDIVTTNRFDNKEEEPEHVSFPEFKPHITVATIPAADVKGKQSIFSWFKKHWRPVEFTVSQLHILLQQTEVKDRSEVTGQCEEYGVTAPTETLGKKAEKQAREFRGELYTTSQSESEAPEKHNEDGKQNATDSGTVTPRRRGKSHKLHQHRVQRIKSPQKGTKPATADKDIIHKRNIGGGIYEVVHSLRLCGEAEFMKPSVSPKPTPQTSPMPSPALGPQSMYNKFFLPESNSRSQQQQLEDATIEPLPAMELPPSTASNQVNQTREDILSDAKPQTGSQLVSESALPPSALVAAMQNSSLLIPSLALTAGSLLTRMTMEEDKTTEIYEPVDVLERWMATVSNREFARSNPTHVSQRGGMYHIPSRYLRTYLEKWNEAMEQSDTHPFFMQEVRGQPCYRLYVDIDIKLLSLDGMNGDTADSTAMFSPPMSAVSYLEAATGGAGMVRVAAPPRASASPECPTTPELGPSVGSSTASSSTYKSLLYQICVETGKMFGVKAPDTCALVLYSHTPWQSHSKGPSIKSKTGYRMYFQRIFVDSATHRRYLLRLQDALRRTIGAVPPNTPEGTTWGDIVSDTSALWERARLLGTVKLRRNLMRKYRYIGIYDAEHPETNGKNMQLSRFYNSSMYRIMFGQMVRVWEHSLAGPCVTAAALEQKELNAEVEEDTEVVKPQSAPNRISYAAVAAKKVMSPEEAMKAERERLLAREQQWLNQMIPISDIVTDNDFRVDRFFTDLEGIKH